jgi:general secretion pathway protein G
MIQRLRQARTGPEGGFTLIELLIVIVILGVLAGIVVFAVGGINDSSKISACKSDVKVVETAAEAAYAGSSPHAYPATIAAMVPGLLKEAPSSTDYTITYTAATGTVTGDLTGGAATTNCSA